MKRLVVILLLITATLSCFSQKVTTIEEAIANLQNRVPRKMGWGSFDSIYLRNDTIHLFTTTTYSREKMDKRMTNINQRKKFALGMMLLVQSSHTIPQEIVRCNIWHVVHFNDSPNHRHFEIKIAPEEIDTILTNVERRIGLPRGVSSDYVIKPREAFTFKARANISGSDLDVRGTFNNQQGRFDIHSDRKITMSLSTMFRGISLALALNPTKMFGKYSDYEININSYSNRYGFDLIYNRTASYTGKYQLSNQKGNINKGIFSQKMLTINAYYAFNYRHFSYPAAFSQSQIQRRSCGSFLLGTSGMLGEIRINNTVSEDLPSSKLIIRQWSLGAGYGYNLVLPHSWLIHASVVPQIVFLTNDRMKTEEGNKKMSLEFPNVIFNIRSAIVHNFQNQFFGISFVGNNNAAGHDDLKMQNLKWRVRLFYGIRI